METTTRKIDEAVLRIEQNFLQICGTGAGAGFTLQPHSPRAHVVAITQKHGLCHLKELADGLTQLDAHDPAAFVHLTSSRSVVDLNCGAGLSGLLIASLAATTSTTPPQVLFIDHAPAAVDFAVELAARLGIQASGYVVRKRFVGASTGDVPDHFGNLVSAVLNPALPDLVGATTIVANHALSIHKFAPGNRQTNLQLQNEIVLAQVDQALARDAKLTLIDLDIAFWGLDLQDFRGMVCASRNPSATRAIGDQFFSSPPNRTPGKDGRVKYFAVEVLEALPCDANLVVWPVGDFEILLSESEVEALLGERAGRCDYPGLQQLLAQEVK